jgi:hypothetical protein
LVPHVRAEADLNTGYYYVNCNYVRVIVRSVRACIWAPSRRIKVMGQHWLANHSQGRRQGMAEPDAVARCIPQYAAQLPELDDDTVDGIRRIVGYA